MTVANHRCRSSLSDHRGLPLEFNHMLRTCSRKKCSRRLNIDWYCLPLPREGSARVYLPIPDPHTRIERPYKGLRCHRTPLYGQFDTPCSGGDGGNRTHDRGFADPHAPFRDPCTLFGESRLRVIDSPIAQRSKTLSRLFLPGNRHNCQRMSVYSRRKEGASPACAAIVSGQ